ncbi:YobI family P-loop NTPase [Psychrobacter alimentarius]|uniref:YobI family P-loop NTPase n=1 Tax=Psychrobacter alimentarius TaxID=261164 RepID=UPI003FD29596
MNQNSSAQSSGTEQSDSSDFKITVLSPSEDLKDNESYKSYEKRLAAALKHKLVFNIAITGIYGSGKSSILNTFKKSYKDNSEWEFLEVSLSTFKVEKISEGDQTDEESVDKEIRGLTPDKIQLIERSILQQFFYAVPQSDIPLSRFKRITENSKETYRITLWVIVLTLWSYIYAFNQAGFITELVDFAEWYQYLNLIILILCTLFIINKIYSYSFGLTEIKFNLHNAEFNIKNEQEKSILNDHLDEILYFFEITGKNVVIIEDLDRFNDTEIFIRLRELNSIINKSCPQRVVFIYAIRDDIFEDNERSKFFDYIIPVIPIVNPTTAYDIVVKEHNSIANELDNKFLLNTCLYFSDMRLLINILNEYESYLEQLQTINLDKNKLFAMVVYKNYYPNEFAKLNSNNGEIYNIFHEEKSKIVGTLITEKYQVIADLELKKDKILNEKLNSIKELNSIYSYTILKRLDGVIQQGHYSQESKINVIVDSKKYSISDIASTAVLKEIAQHQTITLEVTNTSFTVSFSFSDIEDEVDLDTSYLDRLSNTEDKKNGELERLLNEESNTRNQIQYTRRMMLRELLTQTYTITDKPLLKFFIINGHIDETYQSYISYFFEESISLNDKNYALLVNSFDKPDFELELKKCSELIETYLGLDNLSNHSALNFSMLDFLLTDASKKVYLEQYINVVCDGSSVSIEFLKLYFKRDKNLSVLIPEIVDLKEIVIDDVDISGNTKEALFNFKSFIKYIPLNRYQELAYLIEEFRRELSSMKDYVEFVLECFDGDFDRFKAFTDAVHPKLECAEFSAEQTTELNWLGESGYLAINMHTIKQILINNLENSNTAIVDLEYKPLTVISNSDISYLVDDLWSKNLPDYTDVFLKNTDDQFSYTEDEDIYIRALNSLDQFNLVSERFIDKNITKVGNIKEVKNSDIQKYLIAHSKVKHSWSNVFSYFSDSYYNQEGTYRTINSALVHFLESGRSCLQMVSYVESDVTDIEDWEGTKKEFDRRLFACDDLSNEAYAELIGITDNNWDNSNLESISQGKTQTLISLGKLSLTPENWEQVKEYSSKEVIRGFLVKYHQIIIDSPNIIELSSKDVITLLYAIDISDSYKQALTELKAINLIESNGPVRKEIIEIYEDKKMASPVYDQLLKYADSDELKKLLLKQAKYLDKQEILKILKLLDEPYQKLANGQEVEFENTNENNALIHELNVKQIVMRVPKPTRPKGNRVGKKILSTRLQTRVLSDE